MSREMLEAVLQMPYDVSMADDLSRRQYWDRGQQAVSELSALRAENDRLREALRQAIDAIRSLPVDSLGEGHNPEGMRWPIRDELADSLCKALSGTAPGAHPAKPLDNVERCQCCGERYLDVYRVPDEIWERISPSTVRGAGLLCVSCAMRRAAESCIDLYWEAGIGDFARSAPGAWLSMEQLREIEWVGENEEEGSKIIWRCPVCDERDHHAPDCWLAAKIKRAEEKA